MVNVAQGLKVLVVDDSAFARTRVRRQLLADPAIDEVETAADGVVALRQVVTFEPDVITLDVQNAKNGRHFCSARNHGYCTDTCRDA